MPAPLFAVQDVRFRYALGTQWVDALRGVSLQIERGGMLCLSGPSGSGKTTLLNLLGLIESVQEGRVLFEGRDVAALSESERNCLRRSDLGFVFQQFHLLPVLTAEENVGYFLHRQGLPARERQARVQAALQAVGLWEHRAKKPLSMSGGQRQRVAIARAIAKRPRVVLADEPTASLDQETGRGIMDLFRSLHQEQGLTFVVATHDPMVLSYATRHVRLVDGLLAEGAAG